MSIKLSELPEDTTLEPTDSFFVTDGTSGESKRLPAQLIMDEIDQKITDAIAAHIAALHP